MIAATWGTDELPWMTRGYRPIASMTYDKVDDTFAAWEEEEHNVVKSDRQFDLLAESLIN